MSTRSILRTSTLLRSNIRQHRHTSAFSTSQRLSAAKDQGPDKTHMTDKKGGHYDIQSENSKQAHNDRASGGEGNSQATTEKSTARSGNEQAKKDHPEAPDTVIGMNDERGGKGH